ncbi:NUP50 protein, partial [Serilophus lunatus]|nr:NUP50 protein [Serilophus lunatus]
MAKRIAEKELTERNWDQEDEAEEVGTFSVASEEVLRNRAIKKAKRRSAGPESESGGAFKGFKGFMLPSGKGGGDGSGGFGNGAGTKPLEGLANLANGSTRVSSTPPFSSVNTTPEAQSASGKSLLQTLLAPLPAAGAPLSNGPGAAAFAGSEAQGGGPGSYHGQLAALNRSVRDWIVKHVNSNPLCDLSPIFRDYEQYLAGIERQRGSQGGSQRGPASPRAAPALRLQRGPAGPCSGGRTEGAPDRRPGAAGDTQDTESAPASSVSFDFGKSAASPAAGPPGSGTRGSFPFPPGRSGFFGKHVKQVQAVSAVPARPVGAQAQSNTAAHKGGEEEEEEPPKVIVNEIKEDDAFYSKKCKLFYKKDNEFKEKGVGTLHLKPAGNDKTQLLVRADTNLGNILLNVLIPPKMPCTRTGKNNVLIVCVPNPPVDEKNPTAPVTMLIRVKTSEDAEELHNILLEKKEA